MLSVSWLGRDLSYNNTRVGDGIAVFTFGGLVVFVSSSFIHSFVRSGYPVMGWVGVSTVVTVRVERQRQVQNSKV